MTQRKKGSLWLSDISGQCEREDAIIFAHCGGIMWKVKFAINPISLEVQIWENMQIMCKLILGKHPT